MESIHWRHIIKSLAMPIASLVMLSACVDDTFDDFQNPDIPGGGDSDVISFGSSIDNNWISPTRAETGDSASSWVSNDAIEVGTHPESGKPMWLRVAVSDEIISDTTSDSTRVMEQATRAAIPSDDDLDLGVYAYIERSDKGNNANTTYRQFMQNQLVDVSDNYSYYPLKYWPENTLHATNKNVDYRLKFFAYRPYIDRIADDLLQIGPFTVDPATEPAAPTLTFTVPDDVAKQIDLMAAATDYFYGEHRDKVIFPFRHLLSQVNFKVGTIQNGLINSIALSGLSGSGSCLMSEISMLPTDDPTRAFSQSWQDGWATDGDNAGAIIGKPFFMIPQPFIDNADAKLHINLSFKGRDAKYDIDLPLNKFTTEWIAGKTYSYILSTPEEVDVEVTDDVNQNIKSNVKITNTGLAPVYIRAAIVGCWVAESSVNKTYNIVNGWDSETDGKFDWGYTFSDSSPWRKGADGYYYYMTKVASGKATDVPLFKTYTLTAAPPTTGAKLELNIAVQAVSATDISFLSSDGSDWDPAILSVLKAK